MEAIGLTTPMLRLAAGEAMMEWAVAAGGFIAA